MADREQIYTAIRNAHAAGDANAVRKLGDYLASLPEEAQKTESPAPEAFPDVYAGAGGFNPMLPRIAGAAEVLGEAAGIPKGADLDNPANAAGPLETLGSLATGAVATPAAGLAGLGQAVWNKVVPKRFEGAPAADTVRNVQEGLTYQPRTAVGQGFTSAVTAPLRAASNATNAAGEKVTDVTGSPALGTFVKSAGDIAPALLLKGESGGLRGRAPIVKQAPAQIAENYARSHGLDWDNLGDGIKAKLSDIAAKAGNLDGLNPSAVAREAKFSSLKVPVPATRGVLERDRGTLLNENNAASTKAGAPIADIHAAANQALLDNLDVLKGKVSGTGKTAASATSPEQAGAVVQGAARAKQAASKARYDALYTKARATEPNASVHAGPLLNMLDSNPEVQHLGFMQGWFKKAGIDGPSTQVRLADLQDLRSKASAIAKTGGTDGYYAAQVAKAIDEAMQQVPASAKAWKEAAEAFKASKREFSDQGAVSDLVENSTSTDRATALSNTVKAVTRGTPEEIRQVKQTLLTGPDEAVRAAGRKAWREIRAQVIQDIKDRSTNGVAPLKDGSPNLTPSGLKRAIDSYGPQKLDEIFGPGTVKELNRILEVAQDAKTIPPTGGAAVGSTTTQQILNFLGKGLTKGLDKVPVIGKLGGALTQSAIDTVAERTAIKRATTTPLSEALNAKPKSTTRPEVSKAGKQATIYSIATGATKK